MRKLVSSDEAEPTPIQHRAPCSDCPFRLNALPGWLGHETPDGFIAIAQSDGIYPCHTKIGPQCAGLAIFRANICKLPRDRRALRLPRDPLRIFASVAAFLSHHQITH
jgi:hypothetical protein